ncbi:hypothetical protein DPW02_11870 [Aggregatibacter aphrophilus]|jgi:hypothetical protein|nr:hypothetical protein DPW02_11870 [Aggregatibacter aphrophilus]
MKPFDLKEALAGKPCVSENGKIIYIFKDVREFGLDDDTPLVGIIIFNKNNYMLTHWDGNGKNYSAYDYQIVGMYEEPELTSEQVLEKAYKEGLLVESENYVGVFEVFAKTDLGNYVIGFKGSNSFYQIVTPSENGWRLRKMEALKSDTITVTLPKPFKPKPNDKFWFIDKVGGHLQVSHKIKSNHALTGDGNYFRTKSDAQAWLDAMKNALDD